MQATRKCDIPSVTLIKDHKIHKKISVLTGKWQDCETSYSADHEQFLHEFGAAKQPKTSIQQSI